MLTPLTSRALNRRMAGAGLTRRPARGGGGGGAAPEVPTIYAVNGLTSGNRYASTSGNDGDVNGFAFSMLWAYESLADTSTKTLFDHAAFYQNQGAGLRLSSANLAFTVTNGAGTAISSPARTWGAGDLNKWSVATGVYDATANLVRLYVNGVQVGAGTAITGHTPAVSKVVTLGARELGGTPSPNCAVAGVATWTGGVPTEAQIVTHYNACVAALDMVTTLGTLTPAHAYSVKQSQVGGALPATITDTVAADNLAQIGTPTIKTVTDPVWI